MQGQTEAAAARLCIEATKRDIKDLSPVTVARPIDQDQRPTKIKKLSVKDAAGLHLNIGPLSRDDIKAVLSHRPNLL